MRPRATGSQLKPVDALLLIPIVLLPWFFAGVELYSSRVAALALVAAACWMLWREGTAGLGLDRPALRTLLPAFLLVALGAAQLLALPAPVQRVINPNAAAARDVVARCAEPADDDPLWAFERCAMQLVGADSATAAPPEFPWNVEAECSSGWFPSSLYPAATAEELSWYVALLAAFLSIRSRCRSKEIYRAYLTVILWALALLAVYALVQRATWTGSFYGLRPMVGSTIPFGPYVNRNHFAGAMELAVPALLGVGWSLTAKSLRRGRGWVGPGLFAFGGAVICLVGAFVAASKATAVILPASVGALLVFGARGRRQRVVTAILVAALLAVFVGVIPFLEVGERIQTHLERSEDGVGVGDRLAGWASSIPMIFDYPFLGIGFGAFAEVYPNYAPAGQAKSWSALHNDYLEVFVEGGPMAAVLLIWLILAYAIRVVASLRGDGVPSRQRLGVTLGVAGLAGHALVEFNHQMPANALLFVAFAALALPLASDPQMDPRPQRRVVLPLVLLLLVVYGVRAFEGVVGGIAFAKGALAENANRLERSQRLYAYGAVGSYTSGALRRAAQTHLSTYEYRRWRGVPLDDGDRRDLQRATRYYALLHCASPASAQPLEGLGRVYERLEDAYDPSGTDSPGTLGPAGRVAEGLYRMAADRAPNWFLPHDRLALMLWKHGSRSAALQAVRDSAAALPRFDDHRYNRVDHPDAFLVAFAGGSWDALQKKPELKRPVFALALAELERKLGRYDDSLRALDFMNEMGADPPQRAWAAFLRGQTLRAMGRLDEAWNSLMEAEQSPAFAVAAGLEMASIAEQQGHAKAAEQIRARLRWATPDNPSPALEYAASLQRAGDLDSAEATVRAILDSHPDNLRGRVMLVELLLEEGDFVDAQRQIEAMEVLGMEPQAGRLKEQLERKRESKGR